MSSALRFIIYLAAFLCFLLAAFGARWTGRLNLIALGLALWIFVLLVDTLQKIT